ncbi:hypothetical protein HYW74_00280 [Candidatus Pacearchaeota archaeon]|nr:hypothetical protein [Candidatus Pacearchaeota archaeon]
MSLKRYLTGLAITPIIALTSMLAPKVASSTAETLERMALANMMYSNTIYLAKSGNDIYTGSTPEFAVESIDRAVNLANEVSEAKMYIGEGEFISNNRQQSLINSQIELQGVSKDETNLKIVLLMTNYAHVHDINFKYTSTDNSPSLASALCLAKGGILNNCRFEGKSGAQIVLDYSIQVTNNEFINSLSDYSLWISSFGKTDQSVIIKQNLFKDNQDSQTGFAITLDENADLGTTDNIGGNVFENIETAIYTGRNNETQFAIGNYWVDTILEKDGTSNRYVYTDPAEILEKKVINEGTGSVFVDNPLRWNPLCKPTDLDEDFDTDAVDVQETINQALGIDYGDRKPADTNNDGRIDAVDVQSTINDALGL